MRTPRWTTLLRAASRALGSALKTRSGGRRSPTGTTTRPRAGGPARSPGSTYPGDFTGKVRTSYSPRADGAPDPGEVVWTWVPFEEDHSQGKDRPVLLVGRDGPWLLGLQLSSKDHDHDAAQEARYGRYWTEIGTGAWDAQRRPSEVRLNRIIRVDPHAVRREGAVLDRSRFDAVIAAMHKARG